MPNPIIHSPIFLYLIGVIACFSITAGVVLATLGYSSSAPFAIAAACVGVLSTLAAGVRYEPENRDTS